MDSSDPVINPSPLPMRLERFKEVCLEKRKLKGHIEKLIEKREALAVHELASAKSELKRIVANAEEVRAQMKENRLAEVGGTAKGEEAMNRTSSGPPDVAPLFKAAGLGGDGPSPLDTLVVKHSSRNSTSFKSAESPIVFDEYFFAGSPVHTPFKLDSRSGDCTPTIPITEEEGQSCERLLTSQTRRYAELCEERRKLEIEIEQHLANEERTALTRVESARSSLQVVKETIVEIRASLKKANAGDIMASTGDTMENAGDTMVNSGDTMETAGDTMETAGDTMETAADTMETAGDTMETAGDTMENAGDTTMNLHPTVFNDDPHGGDELEDTPTLATTIQPYSSEAMVNPSPSVSDVSTHNKSRPSLHVPESSRGSHFARRTLHSPEDTQATGSQTISTYKPRKKLTKRGHKQIERPRAVSHDGAAPQVQRGFLLLG